MRTCRFVILVLGFALCSDFFIRGAWAESQPGTLPALRLQQGTTVMTAPWQRDNKYPDAKASPIDGFFKRDRPKLVVLVHGQTDKKEGPTSAIGTLAWGRARWGYTFAAEILGGGPLSTLPSANVKAETLNAATWPEGGMYEPIIGLKTLSTVGVDGTRPEHHFIVKPDPPEMPAPGRRSTPTQHRYNQMLFISHRDASVSVHEQAKVLVDQLFENYEAVFGGGEEPQIILVAHSMGGLVSRYLLSNPFSHLTEPRWHFRANFIRNRTVCLVTLATPHQGSPLADHFTNIAQQIDRLPDDQLVIAPGVWSPPQRNKVKQFLKSVLSKFWDPVMFDIRVSAMAKTNAGSLHPALAARQDGTLVPIYAAGGRSPALDLLNDPGMNLEALNRKFQQLDEEHRIEAFALTMLTEFFARSGGNWGRTLREGQNLDWIERVSLNEITERHIKDAKDKFKDPFMTAVANSLGGVQKAMTRQLTNFSPVTPMYLDKKWSLQWGSCPVPFEYAVCGNYRSPSPLPSKIEDFPGWIARVIQTLALNALQMGECAVNWSKWERKHTVDIPCLGWSTAGFTGRPSDGESDTDGMVSIESALGARLLGPGTEYEYFDHRRPYQALGKSFRAGSWYRFPDGPWNMDNHGSILTNANIGKWIRNTIVLQAGPIPGPGAVSTYPTLTVAPSILR